MKIFCKYTFVSGKIVKQKLHLLLLAIWELLKFGNLHVHSCHKM